MTVVASNEDCEKSKQVHGANDKDKDNVVTFDDVLENEVGVGWYQVILVICIGFTNFATYSTFEYIFVAGKIPHRCRITECEAIGNDTLFDNEWLSNAIPKTVTGFSSCNRFAPIGGNGSVNYCPASLFNQSTTVACESYVYENNDSLVNEFNLGCQEWYRTLAGTLNGIGIVLALPISGYLSDKLGRRFVLFVCAVNCGIFGMIKALSVNYEMYLALQIIQTTMTTGIHSTVSIFTGEIVTPEYRVAALTLCSIFSSLGKVLVGLEAMFVRNWRHLILYLHIPCFMPLLYCWITPESSRWLISKGKYDRAKKELEFMARVNRTKISGKTMKALLSPRQTSSEPKELSGLELVRAILKSKIFLIRTFTGTFWFFCATMVYYGLAINSTSLSKNSHLNFILVAMAQIPGFIYMRIVMDRFGRRSMMFSGFVISAACNLAFSFMPTDLYIPRLLIYLLGQLATAGITTAIYICLAEVFPTECRHRMLAFCSMIGHLGQALAPMTPALMEYWSGLPTTVFGCLGVLSALLVFFLPETKGCKLPETIEEAERVGDKILKQ